MTERIKREDGEWRVVDDMGRVIQRLRVAPKEAAAAEITTIAWVEGCDAAGRPTVTYLYDPQHPDVTTRPANT